MFGLRIDTQGTAEMDWDEGPTVEEVVEMIKKNCGSGECDIYLTERDGERVLACYHCNRTADLLG